ncbi:hypothetical protein CRUP_012438, partial [Coryphaenoides rupestris]
MVTGPHKEFIVRSNLHVKPDFPAEGLPQENPLPPGHLPAVLLYSAKILTVALISLPYKARADSFQTTTWTLGDKYIEEYNGWFLEQQKQFLQGRDDLSVFLAFMDHLSYQCAQLLDDEDMLDFLQSQRYDLAVVDAFNPCSFILARKLGLRYVAFASGSLNGPLFLSMPGPVSYVPLFGSQLSHQMNFLERAKNLLFSLMAPIGQDMVWSRFKEVAERHLDSGPPPGGLQELHQKAELWAFNTDFSLEFPQPLLPNTVLVGGLLNKPAKHLDQDLEAWVSGCGEAGFVVVALGSMVSTVTVEQLLNSLLQAVYHGVPVLAIPLFGDQFDNVVRAEAKGLGLSLRPTDITSQRIVDTIQTLTQEDRFKKSAMTLSRIHQSQPGPPGLKLTQWVEHILQSGGGAHLRPVSYDQPWYQRWLLDILLLLSLVLLGTVVLCWAM